MVDTLCCALGCIIIFWLLQREETDQYAASDDEKAKALAMLTQDLGKLQKDVASKTAQSESDRLRIKELLEKLAGANVSKEKLEAAVARRMREIAELEKLNLTLKTDGKAKDTLLGANKAKIEDLLKQLNALADSREAAEKLLAARVKEVESLSKLMASLKDELKDYKGRLVTEEERGKLLKLGLAKRLEQMEKTAKEYETLVLAKRALEKKLDGLSRDLIESLALKEKLSESEKKRRDLQARLGDRGKEWDRTLRLLAQLEGDKKRLLDDAGRLRTAIEVRFAGIELKGRKVVFLVDTSGSMDLIDENTPSSTKWQLVREALVQLMKSLPDLEEFQIVTFAESVSYPMGNKGDWIKFDPKTTPGKVTQALANVKPTGGTNLHRAFDAAFRLRKTGLDTVYVLSDGLPSDGDGLAPEQDRTIKEGSVRSTLLSKHLRAKLKTEWNTPGPGGKRVRINSIGFFYESPDVGAFLWALSRENEGSFVGMSLP
jgi:hypothetical protein